MAADFVEQFQVPFPVYTDPQRASYRVAGMKREFGLGLKTLRRARRAARAGVRQGATKGDPFQQGGVLVVAPSGEVLWRFVSDGAGDHPTIAEVLAALPA